MQMLVHRSSFYDKIGIFSIGVIARACVCDLENVLAVMPMYCVQTGAHVGLGEQNPGRTK